jgi:hypothetical protein
VGTVTEVSLLRHGWLAPLVYLLGVLTASIPEGRGMTGSARLLLPGVLASMHLSWGAGFLFGRRPGVPARDRVR